ncbi:probable ATP-dependent RNA helicase DDX20 [Melanotaenia boesemani]|uniref:probable ATP-dependent RNA helicase DDX20 n=1 Tax=Melanotaenia boesemani TaxID=1250792 RepID=UPI001C055E8E|nr:probable ATP-dependent RNA helicase DDX20 [Melanotaenia boesemani]
MAASMKKAAHNIETRKRTDDVLLSEGIDFGSLLLSQVVLDGLSAAGFQKPSPIQLKAIPLGRCGLDLIVQAKSGTGKTCVFCTIALDSLVPENPATQVLVLAPTREIAVQIHSVVMAIGCAMEGLECHVFIGGRPVSQDKAHLKKCHIAVGSPGRIKQLIELGMLSTASIRLFVLDEADKLLEEGSFQEQINWIFSSLPVNKQMLALSATYPESLAQYLTRYMNEPTFVRLNPSDMGLKGLKQYYKLVQSHPLPHKVFEEKLQHLLELFSKIPFNQALVFSNMHTRAQHLADILSSKGLPAVCISGGLSQDQRLEAMSKLKQYQCRVLISTDLTSRGIDAEKVNLVINLDVPQDWETYMHRIGRAGRFGTQGLAVTYCCHGEEENKMMAIAQKCGLSLTALPSTLEPGLMDEPCDWDVCADASVPSPVSQLMSKPEKKRHTKTGVPVSDPIRDQVVEHSSQRKSDKTHPAPRRGPHTEENTRQTSPKRDTVPPQSSSQASQTLKELQDALPKIPPLSSFKNCRSTFVPFEEAEQDFETFITTGLGRSVEVIRLFGGKEGGGPNDQSGYRESVMLVDDGAQNITRNRRLTSDFSSQRLVSGSCSSQSDMEDDVTLRGLNQTTGPEYRAVTRPQAERPAVHKPSAPRIQDQTICATSGKALSEHKSTKSEPSTEGSRGTHREPPAWSWRDESRKLKKEGKKHSEIKGKPKRKGNKEDSTEMEKDWSTETYWRNYYRAWSDYYTSLSISQEPGYQSYYSVAHNWMAAYRMNAVYMEELMKH